MRLLPFGSSLPTAISISFEAFKGLYEKLLTSIQNKTYSHNSYAGRASSTLFGGLSVCGLPKFLSPLPGVIIVTLNFLSAGTANSLANLNVAGPSTLEPDNMGYKMVDIWDPALTLLMIGFHVE